MKNEIFSYQCSKKSVKTCTLKTTKMFKKLKSKLMEYHPTFMDKIDLRSLR